MLTLALPILLAHAAPSAADLAAEAEAHLQAAEKADHPLDALQDAHASFDSAYLVDGDAGYLCQALQVAERALQSETFTSDEERRSWEETRREDLERLQLDATEKRRANCRYGPEGEPPTTRVALIDPDGPRPSARSSIPDAIEGPSTPAVSVVRSDRRSAERRRRAQTAAGAVLTTAGLGLLGALTGVLVLERQRIGEMRTLVETATAENRKFTLEEDRRFGELKDEVFRGADVAIGVGVAGLVSLGTGVALLVTRKKAARAYALQPYGSHHGVGAALRLKF